MRRSAPVIASLATCALLAACSNGGRPYPSLDRRPQERVVGSGTPVAGQTPAPAPAPMEPSADLVTRLAALRAQALKADGAFKARQGAATRAVSAAAGAAVASDSWSAAQIALADLESARSEAMIALADLDSLLVAAAMANADAPTPDLAAIEQVRGEVTGWIAKEDEVLATLRGRLRS